MTTGTVEERIDEMIAEKRKLADDILAGDAEVNLTELSDEALMDLVRLDVTRAALSCRGAARLEPGPSAGRTGAVSARTNTHREMILRR